MTWNRTIERIELCLFLVVPMASLVLACGGPRVAEPDEVRDNIDDAVVPVIDDTALAFEYLNDSDMLARVGDSLSRSGVAGAFGVDGGSDVVEPEPVVEDPSEPTAGEQIAQFLRDAIFTDDAYEGDGIYRIRGQAVCPKIDDGSGAEPAQDPDCVQRVDDLELRIEVLLVDGGFDASLLVGPHRSRPLRVESRDDSLTVVVDLGASRAALEHVARVTGEQMDLPDVLEGVVAATVRRDGDRAATISLAIREPVSFAMGTEDGPVSVEVAAADPLARLSIDAIARHLELQTNAGPIDASLPWQLLESDGTITGTLGIHWAGATGTLVVDDGAESLTLRGLSLGDDTSRVTLDDQTLFAIDVNADMGRSFDMTVTPTATGATFALTPGLHVVTTIDGRPTAEPGEEVDPAADGDTYEVLFDGDDPILEAIDGTGDQDGALRVVSGRLRLSATDATPVTVEAGQCLLPSEVEPGEHPSLGAVESGPCP